MSLKRLLFGTLATAGLAGLTSCSDPFQLQPAAVPNFIDSVMVFALQGTEISVPSAFDVAGNQPARTDRGDAFDFTFDIDQQGTARIFPTGALGLGESSGIVRAEKPFGEIDIAPTEGYSRDTALVVAVDSVFIVRSRGFAGSGLGLGDDCAFFIGALPRYGKFRVIDLDMQTRSITFESLVNVNCGYRGLLPGLPRK